MKRGLSGISFVCLLIFLVACNGNEPQVEWHSQIFTIAGSEFYYDGFIHNGGAGKAEQVEIQFYFPEELVQRKRSEMAPIKLGEIGAEEISTFTGQLSFDLSSLSLRELTELLKDVEIKIRWKEGGKVEEDYLRRRQDIENGQAS